MCTDAHAILLLLVQSNGADAQEQLPELVHQMQYTWHAALRSCSSRLQGPTTLSQSSLSGVVAAVLQDSHKSSLAERTAKSLQLRLAARHVAR